MYEYHNLSKYQICNLYTNNHSWIIFLITYLTSNVFNSSLILNIQPKTRRSIRYMHPMLAYHGLNLGSLFTTKVCSVMYGISSILLYSYDVPWSLFSSMKSFSIFSNYFLTLEAYIISSFVDNRQIFKNFIISMESPDGESSSHS